MKIKEFVIIPSSIDAMGLIHKPGKGPNDRFGFKNVGNNRGNETKEAPPGTYFTKTGNLVRGRLTKAAREKGARETDPKDKQRSKVPPVTQTNEEEHGFDLKLQTDQKMIFKPTMMSTQGDLLSKVTKMVVMTHTTGMKTQKSQWQLK